MNILRNITKTLLLLLLLWILITPQVSHAYDQRLDQGLIISYSEGVPADILSALKENFPTYLIDSAEYDSSIGIVSAVYRWQYEFADLDGTGESNYLVVLYSTADLNILRILKKEASNFMLIWTSPFDPDGDRLNLVDLNNDNKPEIIVDRFGADGHYYCENILCWTGSEAKIIVPHTSSGSEIPISSNSNYNIVFIKDNPIGGVNIEYYDLDRDGKLEVIAASPVFDADGKEINSVYNIYSWQGDEGFTFKEELQTSLFVTASIKVKPDKWNLSWLRERKDRGRKNHVMGESQDQNLCIGKDDDKSEGSIKVYIGNLADGRTVNEVKLNSIRLNEKLAPEGKVKVKTDKDKRDKEDKHFQGKYLVAEFDKNEAIETIPEIQSRDLRKRDKVKISISGQLNDGKFFVGSYEIELEGTIR